MAKIKQKYILGISWFLLSLLISTLNDTCMKFLGQGIHPIQTTFMRFLFGTLILLPIMFFYGKHSFKTERLTLHIGRSVLLFGGIALWCYGLIIAQMSVITTLSFTLPVFTLILAKVFLKERVDWPRILATVMGFMGILFITLEPSAMGFTPASFLLLLPPIMFAGLDILNKKFVAKESTLATLFYTAFFTMLLGAIPAYYVWTPLSGTQLLLTFALGIGANLLLYCLLKAFAYADAAALAPFRYAELVPSVSLGYFLFGEIPAFAVFIGALIIIPSTFFIIYKETTGKTAAEPKAAAEAAGEISMVKKSEI